MKIATYNIWNSECGMPYRSKYTVQEIQKIKADVICLQEVFNRDMAANLAVSVGYRYWYFDSYPNSEEGLCILSNLRKSFCHKFASFMG